MKNPDSEKKGEITSTSSSVKGETTHAQGKTKRCQS